MLKQFGFAACLVGATNLAFASCTTDGKTSQAAFLSVEGKTIERWEPIGSELHRVKLPQGFELGLRIEPATPEKYRESFARFPKPAIDELVKIDLFDVSGATPVNVSTTWGGANSRQGFGPRVGANGVPVIIELWLHKPTCVTPDMVANLK
jgi:hypothetical protein